MCFNSYFIGGMYFRLMQTRFSQTHSRLTINFSIQSAFSFLKILRLIRIIRLVHFAKLSEAFNVSLACFIIGLFTQVFSHVLFSLHPPKGYRESDKTFNQPNSCGIILVLHDDLGFIRYYLLFGKRVF